MSRDKKQQLKPFESFNLGFWIQLTENKCDGVYSACSKLSNLGI